MRKNRRCPVDSWGFAADHLNRDARRLARAYPRSLPDPHPLPPRTSLTGGARLRRAGALQQRSRQVQRAAHHGAARGLRHDHHRGQVRHHAALAAAGPPWSVERRQYVEQTHRATKAKTGHRDARPRLQACPARCRHPPRLLGTELGANHRETQGGKQTAAHVYSRGARAHAARTGRRKQRRRLGAGFFPQASAGFRRFPQVSAGFRGLGRRAHQQLRQRGRHPRQGLQHLDRVHRRQWVVGRVLQARISVRAQPLAVQRPVRPGPSANPSEQDAPSPASTLPDGTRFGALELLTNRHTRSGVQHPVRCHEAWHLPCESMCCFSSAGAPHVIRPCLCVPTTSFPQVAAREASSTGRTAQTRSTAPAVACAHAAAAPASARTTDASVSSTRCSASSVSAPSSASRPARAAAALQPLSSLCSHCRPCTGCPWRATAAGMRAGVHLHP